MTEQRPSKDLTSWGDAKLAPEEFHFGGVRYVRGDLVDRLRTALTGISSCSTCEVCRGAATLALGERITEEIHAAVDERLDRVERELAQPPEPCPLCKGRGAIYQVDNEGMEYRSSTCFRCERAAQPPPAEHPNSVNTVGVMQWSTESCPGCGATTNEAGIRFHASGCTWFYGTSSETALR